MIRSIPALLLLAALASQAQSTKPIPPFSVWQLRSNATTESQVGPTSLNPQGFWLLTYIDATQATSQLLLAQLQALATQEGLDPAKVVIVVANFSGAKLSRLALQYPGLAAAAWTHDVKFQAAQALQIQGTPHLFGMVEGQQRWNFGGAQSAANLQSMVLTWVGYNRLPPNKLTRTKVAKLQPSKP